MAKSKSENNNNFEAFKKYQPPIEQYQIGKKIGNLADFKNLYPTFSFQYLCLDSSKLAFNNPEIHQKDYQKLFQALNSISKQTYEIISTTKSYHFHDVDFEKDTLTITAINFLNQITDKKIDSLREQTPTLYQFKLYQEKRLFGFLGYHGVFNVVYFDFHQIYKRK